MKNLIARISSILIASLVLIPVVHAGLPTTSVPEPSMLPLFAVAAIAFYIAKKRKK